MGTFGCNYLRNIRIGILGAHNLSVLRHYLSNSDTHLVGLQLALSHGEVSEGQSDSQSFEKTGDLLVVSILDCYAS